MTFFSADSEIESFLVNTRKEWQHYVRNSSKTTVFFVEGRADAKFVKGLNIPSVYVVQCGGKPKVKAAFEDALKHMDLPEWGGKNLRFLGLLDRDGEDCSDGRFIYTDFWDLESTLFLSDATSEIARSCVHKTWPEEADRLFDGSEPEYNLKLAALQLGVYRVRAMKSQFAIWNSERKGANEFVAKYRKPNLRENRDFIYDYCNENNGRVRFRLKGYLKKTLVKAGNVLSKGEAAKEAESIESEAKEASVMPEWKDAIHGKDLLCLMYSFVGRYRESDPNISSAKPRESFSHEGVIRVCDSAMFDLIADVVNNYADRLDGLKFVMEIKRLVSEPRV